MEDLVALNDKPHGSEMARIQALMEAQGEIGAIPEQNHYRVTSPTRTMVYMIARVWGVSVRTRVEKVAENSYLLWYRVVPS